MSTPSEPIFVGTKYAKDGYIYNTGVKAGKHFTLRRNWQYYWHPVLEQVSRIERAYYKLHCKRERNLQIYKQILHDIVNTVPPTVVKDDIKYIVQLPYVPGEESVFGEYVVRPDVGYGIHYTTNFIGKDRPLAHPLAKQLHDYSNKLDSACKYEIGGLLHDAIVNYLRNHRNAAEDSSQAIRGNGATIYVMINDHQYLYRATARYHGFVEYEKINWPGDNYTTMEVK